MLFKGECDIKGEWDNHTQKKWEETKKLKYRTVINKGMKFQKVWVRENIFELQAPITRGFFKRQFNKLLDLMKSNENVTLMKNRYFLRFNVKRRSNQTA